MYSFAAYQFNKIMGLLAPDVARRIRERKVLCILVGHDELTSQIPQFTTDKTGKASKTKKYYVEFRDHRRSTFSIVSPTLRREGRVGHLVQSVQRVGG